MLLELCANAVTTLSIVLAMRNSIHTWWTGIIGSVLFAMLFLHSQLYADSALQAFFIVTSLIGWWNWSHAKGTLVKPVTWSNLYWSPLFLWSIILGTFIYGIHLTKTNDFAPYTDATVFSLSIAGQYLLMQRKVETWIVWLVVNTISVCLYALRGLELTALLYLGYWINAWVGLYRWKKVAV